MSVEMVVTSTALTLLAVFVWSIVVTVVDAMSPPRINGRQDRILLALAQLRSK